VHCRSTAGGSDVQINGEGTGLTILHRLRHHLWEGTIEAGDGPGDLRQAHTAATSRSIGHQADVHLQPTAGHGDPCKVDIGGTIVLEEDGCTFVEAIMDGEDVAGLYHALQIIQQERSRPQALEGPSYLVVVLV